MELKSNQNLLMHTPYEHLKGLKRSQQGVMNRDKQQTASQCNYLLEWCVCRQWALAQHGQRSKALSAQMQVVIFLTTTISYAPGMFFRNSGFLLHPWGLRFSHWQLTIPLETNKIIRLQSLSGFAFFLLLKSPTDNWENIFVIGAQLKLRYASIPNPKM